jgi:phytoene/squalene synthetase
MRTTITLDEDVAALIESERARTGESFRTAVNRMLRRAARTGPQADSRRPLPELPGRPLLDVSDVSSLLAVLDDERRAHRGVA